MTGKANAGLSGAQAAQRLADEGPNTLPGAKGHSLLTIAAQTLREPMFLLLLGAGAIYLVFGSRQEGLTLLGFVVITLLLTLFQEGKTERAIDALRDLTSPRALAVRDGQAQRIAGREVVRGDLLKLSEGDRVPADALLVSAEGMRADESLLTGEAVAVGKRIAKPEEIAAADAAPPPAAAAATATDSATDSAKDRINNALREAPGGEDKPMVYAGTLIVQGHAMAQVTATGARSEIGRIGTALNSVESGASPLQKQTAVLVRNLALLALALSLALVLVHGLLNGDWLQAVLAGIALAMAMLPEEYPLVLTVFPALGARRLAQEGVLTRRINAIETLGATTVLCSDKTGTLTGNRMTVTQLAAGGAELQDRLVLSAGVDGQTDAALPDSCHVLVEVAILASVVEPFDPMEKAFHQLGARFLAGSEHLHADWRLLKTYPLSPARRAMTQVWAAPGSAAQAVATKGAPETVMDLCRLDAKQRATVAAAVDDMAKAGLRVLAVARATFKGQALPDSERDFTFSFIGLLGLADPVRAEVPAAVADCQAAGIRVVMITGDYPATALAIAQEAGITAGAISGVTRGAAAAAGEGQVLLSGTEIDQLDDAALGQRLATVRVCARIAPEQKLRIVQALKADGEIVAMTGDGVNDAPALRAAHVGVAMGGRGTDVAREAASLVLVDDNFAAIVRGIRLGRSIFDNLRKAMSYTLAVHVPIAGMALLPVLFGWPTLLFPMHIAFLELIIDPACTIAFENEPADANVMQRPPRDVDAPLFAGATLWLAFTQGLGVLAVVMAAFAWAQPRLPEAEARAFAFATLVVGNLSLILSNRSATLSLWATLQVRNRTLWGVVAAAFTLLLGALYVPWAVGVLRFAPLPLQELATACGLGLSSVGWFEGIKWVRRRRQAAAA